MDRSLHELMSELADMMNAKFHELYHQGAFRELEERMKKMKFDDTAVAFAVDMGLNIYNRKWDNSLTLYQTGISCIKQGETELSGGGATPGTYLLKGELVRLPHDCCPECWGPWDDKLEIEQCPECGCTLGTDVLLMLDSNICPHCDQGRVSFENPVCSHCSFEIDPKKVTWG